MLFRPVEVCWRSPGGYAGLGVGGRRFLLGEWRQLWGGWGATATRASPLYPPLVGWLVGDGVRRYHRVITVLPGFGCDFLRLRLNL